MRQGVLRALSGYALGLAVGVACFGGLAFASSGPNEISAEFDNIHMLVNGAAVTTAAEPFIYNHNVYVPISAIGHGLGARVNWVGATRTVAISYSPPPAVAVGSLDFAGLPVYAGTHTVFDNGRAYVSAFGLAVAANQPYYADSANGAVYIGRGPTAGMPISAFYDVRDYGDYAFAYGRQSVGPTYGWTDGAPKIDGIVYPNANSLVWAPQPQGSQVPGVEYNLRGNYSSLTGAFGLDDASSGGVQAQLTITGDGKQLYQSPWMGVREAAAPVSADVKGIGLLTISFALRVNGTVYGMGQTVPAHLAANVDFADVNVH